MKLALALFCEISVELMISKTIRRTSSKAATSEATSQLFSLSSSVILINECFIKYAFNYIINS